MKTAAGLWIDHRKAMIGITSSAGKRTLEIRSDVEREPSRHDGIRSTTPYEAHQVKADDRQERDFTEHINQYYAKIIAELGDADAVLIFGPGEAKDEFKKRLDDAGPGKHSITVESAGPMTERQIAARIRDYCKKSLATSGSRHSKPRQRQAPAQR